MPDRRANHAKLFFGVGQRHLPVRGPQCLSNPFRHRHLLPFGGSLNVTHFLFVQEYLQSLTHTYEYKMVLIMSQMLTDRPWKTTRRNTSQATAWASDEREETGGRMTSRHSAPALLERLVS